MIDSFSRRLSGHPASIDRLGRTRIIDRLAAPSAQFSLTLRVALPNKPGGVLGKVTAAITRAGGSIVALDTVEAGRDSTLREITIECSSVGHRGDVISTVHAARAARIVEITDPTFEVHRRGKIHTGLNIPLKSRDDLSMAYTPGVARVCTAIAENRQKAFKYTIQGQHRRGGDPTGRPCWAWATSARRPPCR